MANKSSQSFEANSPRMDHCPQDEQTGATMMPNSSVNPIYPHWSKRSFACLMQMVFCCLGLGLSSPVEAMSVIPQAQLKQLPPAPPSTPPPNRTRSGGSLSQQAMCGTGTQALRALVPIKNPVLTTEPHPTFWFYVPYGSDQIQQGEFSVLVGLNETSRLYRTRFTLPTQPGIVSVRLPELPQYALTENTFYHWYFKLACDNGTTEQVDGWVQRVPLTPERQQQIQTADAAVWYDALTLTAQQLAANPTNAAAQTQWRNLLIAIEADDLVEQPIVGAVQIETSSP